MKKNIHNEKLVTDYLNFLLAYTRQTVNFHSKANFKEASLSYTVL